MNLADVVLSLNTMPNGQSEDEEPFIQLHELSGGTDISAIMNVNMPDNINTVMHCHDLRPVTSNKKAWKKLILASSLCFIFAIGEVVGK